MDKLIIRLLPLMKAAAAIGILAGFTISALGVARMFDLIDMGGDFENIEPIWMIGGGLGLAVALYFKFQKYRRSSAQAEERLST